MNKFVALFVIASVTIVAAWPAPEFTGYTSRTVYNGYHEPIQTYVVEHAMPYYAPPPAPLPYNQDYRAPAADTLSRQKRQMMGGMGGGLAGSQAQAQSQSMGTGMGMGGMGMGFPYMGFPFMG